MGAIFIPRRISDQLDTAFASVANDDFMQRKAGNWTNRTVTQVTADLSAMVGDSGSGGTKGLVPAPAAGDAAASKFLKADGTWATVSGGGSGTVTSVGASFTGGIVSVSGSPVTTSGTLALTVAGTSGGIPYFSGSSAWATSAALGANQIVVGGGAGAAPASRSVATLSVAGVLALGSVSSALSAILTGKGFTATTTGTTALGLESSAASSSSGGAFCSLFSNDGAALASGDRLGGFLFGGSSSASALRNTVLIAGYTSQAWVDGSAYGSELQFHTTANGATTRTLRVTIGNDGAATFTNSVVSTSATAGIGYATGAGGTVTQGGSDRLTGVTLNKVCGAITMRSEAGSTSWQTFTVTNSAVAATDTVVVCQKSGTDKYMIHVTAVGAGSFQVTFATTGGTTTEQPVFSFSIIKGVAA